MAIYMWREVHPFFFTATQWDGTVTLNKTWNPTAVTLETSTDWTNWSTYKFWTSKRVPYLTRLYFRNTSETDTWFIIDSSNYYRFSMTWNISANWDIGFLLNKNSTKTLSNQYCFSGLFLNCTSLTTAPELPATNLKRGCYQQMFFLCSNLSTLPLLPALTLSNECYQSMFFWCSKIKLSTTQTWDYQTAYRIPTSWTWAEWSYSLDSMFYGTWWTFTGDPSINTTYYTSNTVV